MKFPSTSTKLQPFKSTADNQITSRDFLPESGKSDPGSSGAMSTTIEKDNIGDGMQTLCFGWNEFQDGIHVIQNLSNIPLTWSQFNVVYLMELYVLA